MNRNYGETESYLMDCKAKGVEPNLRFAEGFSLIQNSFRVPEKKSYFDILLQYPFELNNEQQEILKLLFMECWNNFVQEISKKKN